MLDGSQARPQGERLACPRSSAPSLTTGLQIQLAFPVPARSAASTRIPSCRSGIAVRAAERWFAEVSCAGFHRDVAVCDRRRSPEQCSYGAQFASSSNPVRQNPAEPTKMQRLPGWGSSDCCIASGLFCIQLECSGSGTPTSMGILQRSESPTSTDTARALQFDKSAVSRRHELKHEIGAEYNRAH